MVQRRGVDPLVVDVGAVQRAGVADLVAVADPPDHGVAPGDGDVVEEDVGVGMATEGGDVGVEHESAAGVRAAADDEHAHALGQFGERFAEVFVELEAVRQLGEAEGGLVVAGQRLPARRAEVGADLVLVAAPAASHAREGTPAGSGSSGAPSTWTRGRAFQPLT